MRPPVTPSLFDMLHNSGLFSSHWVEHRLELEPEWRDLRGQATEALETLGELWKIQHTRVENYGDEQGLEEAFIQWVFRALGWKIKYQTWLQGREPDYALFLDDAALDAAIRAGRNEPSFWTAPVALADAKAWHIDLDRPVRVNNNREYPPEQMEWYLDKSRLGWGILTNGKLWRLIPRERTPQQRRFETYLEVDLESLLNEWLAVANDINKRVSIVDDFLRFYLFFGRAGFTASLERKSFVQRALDGSSEYRLGVSEGIKGQTFEAMRICIEGFLALDENDLKGTHDLGLCREQSFVLLCRLLFILYAEDRRLLPYKVNSLYTMNRSLGRMRDEIATRLEGIHERGREEFSRTSTALWDDLQALFDLIDRGHARYGVPPYNGGLFDSDAHPFLVEKKLSDWHLARVIDNFGHATDPERPGAGRFRVDYRDLAIQHLGGIYEGLLEVHPHLAQERMVVYARRVKGLREEIVREASQPKPEGFERTETSYGPGSIYLVTDKGERRAFGSYYTPDHIVEAIVQRTLGPLCAQLTVELENEIAAAQSLVNRARGPEHDAAVQAVEQLQHNYLERVLRLRVLDPAMGSGHFLLQACQFLAEEIATNPYTGAIPETVESSESAVSYCKRRVIENCLYGVDINSMAVELAKLALWLETVAADRPLTFLDHHLRHGNSLIGAKVAKIGSLGEDSGLFREMYEREFAAKLPSLLSPLAEIGSAPSESLAQVKEKGKRFAAYVRSVEPFRLMADLWCAAQTGARINTGQYRSALEVVDKPIAFKRQAAEKWFDDAVSKCRHKTSCFHWELAFPEVFFGDTGPHLRPGFDAIIGNPPYEVLSEKESGLDLAPLRNFIDVEPVYAPSKRGKNNLYKLFICRALDLLADGGHLGFIVPMALLGDEIAAEVRKMMTRLGAFTSIEAFPQKDRVDKRVFREAKLSTALFTMVRDHAGNVARPFRARVQPANLIEEDSPSFILTTAAIPLYDPNNFTIASCDQADWDLATRIVASGRMTRLGEFAEFFQGEVNETNEKAKGTLMRHGGKGKLVTRGASICLYAVRPASQGEDMFLDVDKFLEGKGPTTKAYHHRHRRVGLQETSPQNNFRRIISALVPAGEFFNHKVNYLPEHTSKHPLEFMLALLNSRLSDWYFRLGSTNAAVSHYQLYNLPCPSFAEPSADSAKVFAQVETALNAQRINQALNLLTPLAKVPPFSLAIRDGIIAAVQHIIGIESERGEIARVDRSALDPSAQPYQDFIDQLFFGMAGLTDKEITALEKRYATML